METMTLEQLKDLLSTYGSNPSERNMQVLVTINGVRTPIIAGEMEWGTWDEKFRTWVDREQGFVLLEAGEAVTA